MPVLLGRAGAAVIKLTENLAVELKGTGVTAFSVHPGLLPIGISEPALTSGAPADSVARKILGWLRQELEGGREADPAATARVTSALSRVNTQ